MKTSLDFPDELYQRLKVRAADECTTVKNLVERALDSYLGKSAQALEPGLFWRTDSGKWLPGIRLDDRDSLFNAMDQT
jgi:hypothetical protein